MWFPPTGGWVDFGSPNRPDWRWQGPQQCDLKTEDGIRRCYRFLRSVPYQSAEDRARITELEFISIAELKMTDESPPAHEQ